MPKYAVAYERRHQREVLGRKGALEAQMIFESESVPTKKAPQSPISVFASLTDIELKPLTLPGTWVVVGKRGRPAKVDGKMYDDVKAKKKKRKRKSKTGGDLLEPSDKLAAAADVAASLLAALAEVPSTSKNVDRSVRTFARHAKAAARGRSAKAWEGYRVARKEKLAARDVLINALAADGMLEENREAMPPGASSKFKPEYSTPRKTDKNSHAQKTRRARRFEAAAARCFSLEEADAVPVSVETPRATETKLQTTPQMKQAVGVTTPLPEATSTPPMSSLEPTPPTSTASKATTKCALKDKKADCSIM